MKKIHNLLIRILSAFILSSPKRKEFRKKNLHGFARINAEKENTINIPRDCNIELNIIGKNNVINISEKINKQSKIIISIVGDNNHVEFGEAFVRNLILTMGALDDRQINNASFYFGDSYAWHMDITMMENNTKIKIGDGCMISNNIELRCTDDHTVLDLEGNVLNKASDITIGNHVWLCKDVLILKNTTIPDDCIVGAKSVVAKRFTEPNCAICGNPAKVVKTGITWDGARPDLYEKEHTPQTISAVKE